MVHEVCHHRCSDNRPSIGNLIQAATARVNCWGFSKPTRNESVVKVEPIHTAIAQAGGWSVEAIGHTTACEWRSEGTAASRAISWAGISMYMVQGQGMGFLLVCAG